MPSISCHTPTPSKNTANIFFSTVLFMLFASIALKKLTTTPLTANGHVALNSTRLFL